MDLLLVFVFIELSLSIHTSRSKWQPYNISVPLDLKVTLKDTRLILNFIYVWKLNQTMLELDFRAVKFCSSLDGIWTHTIDTLQHHSLSLTSSALDHSTTSTPFKRSSNNRSVTFSRKANLGIDVRHVYKRIYIYIYIYIYPYVTFILPCHCLTEK
jgi:hypothetical protein